MKAWLSALLLAFAVMGGAHADERITDFFSDIAVQENGDLIVSERIRIIAEGDQISRGILRDFPTRYSRRDGTRVIIGFDVLGVTRDGAPEPFITDKLTNGVRVRIGSGDVLLASGEYEYVIRYRTTRQIGFFAEFDELYWNVTGTGWTFPIDRASARITLPAARELGQTAAYTGSQGSTEGAARVVAKVPGSVTFETTAPLGVQEGLTVAVAWPKGVVTPPSNVLIWFYGFRDNLPIGIAIAGFILLLAYYAVVYKRTRRQSPPRVVPLYEPPDGVSAPSVRFIMRQKYDPRTYVVGMMELISLRAMRMKKTETGTRFEREDGQAGQHAASDPMLAVVLKKLFRKDASFNNDGLEGNRFSDAREHLEGALEKRWVEPLFLPSGPRARRGLQLWAVYLVACLAAAWWQGTPALAPLIAGALIGCAGFMVLTLYVSAWRRNGFSVGFTVILVLFVMPFFAAGVIMLIGLAATQGLVVLAGLLPVLLMPIVVSGFRFLRGYTEEGYRVLDQIAGLKQYLTLAEGPRLQALVTPEEKLAVYERCLPYAVALDVGGKWAAAFSGLFAGVAAMAALDAMQQHYGGHDMMNRDQSDLVRDVSRDLNPVSVSSSSSAPGSSGNWSNSSSGSSSSSSSSSGSSGSGSSGGGGGGGGGSGW